jgi:hypothetical protein
MERATRRASRGGIFCGCRTRRRPARPACFGACRVRTCSAAGRFAAPLVGTAFAATTGTRSAMAPRFAAALAPGSVFPRVGYHGPHRFAGRGVRTLQRARTNTRHRGTLPVIVRKRSADPSLRCLSRPSTARVPGGRSGTSRSRSEPSWCSAGRTAGRRRASSRSETGLKATALSYWKWRSKRQSERESKRVDALRERPRTQF